MLLTATLSLLLMQQAPAENVDWDAEFGGEEVERDPATGEIPVDEARMAMIVDGRWRDEALAFDRVLLMFDAAQRDAAADLWRRFAKDDAIDNRINKQDESGAWREAR